MCKLNPELFMIKSQFSFDGISLLWLLSLGGTMMLYITISLILHSLGIGYVAIKNLTQLEVLLFLGFYPIVIFLAFAQVKINCKIILIDVADKTIAFKNYFTRQSKIYQINYFDGYLDTLKKSPKGDFRILYLVKNNKPTHKISGRTYSNIDEIETGLKELKYYGYKKLSLISFIKIFFHRQTLD
jgi:hypothetical protein